MLGGFRFRFWENDLDDLLVMWDRSGQINRLGLWFELNTFGNLARLDGWSGPVPPLSDMGQTGLTAQPSGQQDAENLYIWVEMAAEASVVCRRLLLPSRPRETGPYFRIPALSRVPKFCPGASLGF
jgi:hypothetical protein